MRKCKSVGKTQKLRWKVVDFALKFHGSRIYPLFDQESASAKFTRRLKAPPPPPSPLPFDGKIVIFNSSNQMTVFK